MSGQNNFRPDSVYKGGSQRASKLTHEVSSRIVVGILVIALITSLGGTFIVLTKMSRLVEPGGPIPTGLAQIDTGVTRIQIEDLLAIDVNDNNQLIDFGECVPTSVPSSNVSISSEMNQSEINATAMSCVNSTLPAYLLIQNVGNVDANVTVYAGKLGPDLLTSSRAEIYYRTTNGTNMSGCKQSDAQTNYLQFTGIGEGNKTKVCLNLTPGEDTNSVLFWVNLTVPNDARTPGTGPNVTLTFQAWSLG